MSLTTMVLYIANLLAIKWWT